MTKRTTIKTARQLVKEVNKQAHIHVHLRVSFDGYILSFDNEDMIPEETAPMSCKECCCYLMGILRNTATTIEQVRTVKAQQEYLMNELNGHKARISENAKAMHTMYLRAIAAERELAFVKAEARPSLTLITKITEVINDYLDERDELSL